jgi:hypothetical protein
LTRKTVILAKIESTYGTDPVPTPAANTILVSDVNLKVAGEAIARDFIRSSLSPLQFVRGIRQVEVSFKTELKGTGTRGTLPSWGWEGPLFRACGMSEVVTASTSIAYAPVSTDFESVALYVYKDGIFHKVLGCRGSFKLSFEVGKYPVAEWTFKGRYASPSDATPGAQTISSVKPVPVLGANFNISGHSGVTTKLELDLNNTVSERRSINAATGISGFEITGRAPQGSIDPEVATEAAAAYWSDWESALAMTMNLGPIGSDSGNIIEVNAPKVQYKELTYADRNGILTYQIPIALAMSAGDDELTITIT